MIYYKPDYLGFTRYRKHDYYDVCYFFNNDEIKEHVNRSENKLFCVTTNPVYYQKFYGEILYEITGLNFLNYVGCQ